MRRLEQDIFYVSSRAAILIFFGLYISDVMVYLGYARELTQHGQIPYRDLAFEYPPLALPFVFLPGWLFDALGFTNLQVFHTLFALTLLPFDFWLFRRFSRRPPVPGAGFFYVFLTSWMALLLFDRFDLAVGFCLAAPFLLEKRTDHRFALSWGLGGALKLVPLLLAPLWLTETQRPARLARFALLAALPLALGTLLAFWLGHGTISFLVHHSQRGVQVESLLGCFVLAAHALHTGQAMAVDSNFGAQHLPPLPGLVALSRVLFWGGLAATYGVLLWRPRRLAAAAWLVMLAFVTFGYVLSPQFLLWLIPLGLCAAGEVRPGAPRRAWLTLFSGVVALTGISFYFYWDYVRQEPFAISLVAARNLALLTLWALSWRWTKPLVGEAQLR